MLFLFNPLVLWLLKGSEMHPIFTSTDLWIMAKRSSVVRSLFGDGKTSSSAFESSVSGEMELSLGVESTRTHHNHIIIFSGSLLLNPLVNYKLPLQFQVEHTWL